MPDATLPVATIFDMENVETVIQSGAGAIATQLSLTTRWESDTSASGQALQIVSDINPVNGIYNLCTEGQWSSETSGAVVVDIDQSRRRQLAEQFVNDFRAQFRRELAQSPAAAQQYLRSLATRTQTAIDATNERFGDARQINDGVCSQLNDALDRAYRIRTAASIAFMVVGCLPAATAAAGATAGTAAAAGTVTAAQGCWWAATAQVAGVGLLYGFFCEMAFDEDEVRRSSAGAVQLNEAAEAAGFGAGGTVAQTGLERYRTHAERQLASNRNLANARAQLQNTVYDAHASARGVRPSPRLMNNEVQRRLASDLAEHAERNLQRGTRLASRSGSAIFIGFGLYMMRNEIRTAVDGLTTGLDRTR